MPYRRRIGTSGLVFHVLNRGVRRLQLFDTAGDYRAFLDVFAEAQTRTPITCLAYCVMPNHFHLVLRPSVDGQLSAFMAWLTTTHSKRWHAWRRTAGIGHVYQGRFKAFPVFCDTHYLTLCRYVERNALRANLVSRAEHWPWSSLAQYNGRPSSVVLDEWPVARPPDWNDLVQLDVHDETREIREALRRNAPYGPAGWRERMATQLGLGRTLAPIGRSSSKGKQPASL